ncbi:LPD25 domain-containing protein, partial [Clostridioides difficile]|uniref:LPD25 domain-containing protein n=1 Tax=Clostridioides difficile TaxID=1496 RepID=UPI00406A5EEC
MAAKYQLITELYRRTGVSVAKSPQAWQSFLSSACRNYKCRFDEQLLIYAQRPDAVAVAELGTWNKLFKRWVNKDSKGIAVFDPKGRRNTLKYYFDISDTHEGYYGSRPVPIWQMDERYEQAVKERLSDRFGEIEETDLAETLFKTAENAVEDNLPDYLSQLKSVTQDSFLEGLDEYNIEVLYKRLAVNSVAFMLMSRCGLDVKEYFDREDFADIVNFNTPHTINAIGIATSDISEMALREISAAIRNVQMEARGENRTFAPKSQSRYDVGRKQPERSENNERNHIHKAGGLSYSRPNITDRARASAWQIRYDAQGVSGAAQESDLSEPADRGDAKSASLRGGTDGTQTVGASDEAALNGAGRDGGTEGKSPDAVGRIDEQHPQPSGGSHLDGTDLQLSIANEEEVSANLPTVEQQIEKITQAEDEKSSAFVVSQEDIDSVLQMGSSCDKSKYRIYRQLQKNSDSKTNIEFLKKEYGTGGGTHIFPDGTQGGRWADSKGIAIEKQGSYTDPDLRLSWSKVEKRLRELIKNDRYLNPKEKDHYADYLEQVSAPQYEIDTQRKLVRQRFIQSKQALSPADKRDSLALRLSDFIRDLDGYEKELLSQVNRTDLANINDRQMEEQLSDPATVQQLLDFLALVQGKTSDTYSRSNAWYFSKELTELHPMHYLCHEGDVVYLGADKYEVQSVTEDRVTLQNVQFPILMQAYNHTKLSELLNKNPANDHLKVVVTDRQKSETLTEKKPDSLEFSIGFSEHPCFYADGLGDDIEISFALGNKLLGILDEKQHRERQDESKKVGWYKKTDFQINAVINGENFRYDGRFDIGDGEGDLIAHLKNHYDYCLSPNCPFIPEWKKQGEDAYRKKMESLRWGREVFIPYLEQHTELSQEDEMQLDAFMASESYWYKEKEELLEQAKKFIDDYAYKKYGQSDRVDYSDLSKIEIATATTEDGQRKFMVMLDLENYRMKFYENGKCTDYTEYLSLADMIAADISHSDFESFVLERAEKYNQLYREEKTEAVPKDTDRLNARELESSREQLSEPIEDDFIGRGIVLDNRRYVIERISE